MRVKREEKVAAISLPFACTNISSRFFCMSLSEIVLPESFAPVESDTRRITPSFAISLRRPTSAGFSFTGLWSNFQSPLWRVLKIFLPFQNHAFCQGFSVENRRAKRFYKVGNRAYVVKMPVRYNNASYVFLFWAQIIDVFNYIIYSLHVFFLKLQSHIDYYDVISVLIYVAGAGNFSASAQRQEF